MNFKSYSYQSANLIIPKAALEEAEQQIARVNKPFLKGSATLIREDLLLLLRNTAGWSNEVRISSSRAITVTAKKGQIALCLQTGNMARFYADLLKLQAQFLDGKITSAIYILPTKEAAKALGSNLACYERLLDELTSTFFKVITVPLLIYGFYAN